MDRSSENWDRLAVELSRRHARRVELTAFLATAAKGCIDTDAGPGASLCLAWSHTVQTGSRPSLLEAALASLRDRCSLQLLPSKRDPKLVVLEIRNPEWRAIAAPESPVWRVTALHSQGGAGPDATERRLAWTIVDHRSTPRSPLPMWLLARAKINHAVGFTPSARVEPDARWRDLAGDGPDIGRIERQLHKALDPLHDALTALAAAEAARPLRTLDLKVRVTDLSGKGPLRVVSRPDPAWPAAGLRLSRQSDGRGPRLELAPDPDAAGSWILSGTDMEGSLRLHELRYDRYRLQRDLVSQLRHRLRPDRLAAAATQVPVPAQPRSAKATIQPLAGEVAWTERQAAAITLAETQQTICCIKGPPGTGKSEVIVAIVRRAVRRGESVLFVAPTHVAIDEVLRRLHDLRCSGDETEVEPARIVPRHEARVDPVLLRYAHDQVANTVISDAIGRLEGELRATASVIEEPERRVAALQSRLDRLTPLARARQQGEDLEARYRERRDGSAATAARHAKASELLPGLRKRAREAEALEIAARPNGFFARLFRSGPHRKAAEALRLSRERLSQQEQEVNRLDEEREEARRKAAEAKTARDQSVRTLGDVTDALRRDGIPIPDALEGEIARLDEERRTLEARLGAAGRRRAIMRRWREWVGTEEGRRWVKDAALGAVNLVVATTQGIASSVLRDRRFDLVVCDEASRVTRGEILTPASRGSRCVIVGDEHQLPPYVETEDEQVIHALAVLDRAAAVGCDLQAAATALVEEWNLDEEDLRPIRVTEVVSRATELGGLAGEVVGELATLRHTDDPGERRVAWRKVANAVTGSCFDHILGLDPAPTAVRLDIQRRMPRATAELVAGPVYGGDYRSPPDGGPAPLLTPRFRHSWMIADTSARCAARERARKGPTDERVGKGFVNQLEADWVVRALEDHYSTARSQNHSPPSMMVITFYLAQARLIESKLTRELRPCTRVLPIDRCQGQQSDVVVVSFVRSHGQPRPGYGLWLQDGHRLNVALTRSRGSLVLVGNLETLKRLRGIPTGESILAHLAKLANEEPDHVVSDLG